MADVCVVVLSVSAPGCDGVVAGRRARRRVAVVVRDDRGREHADDLAQGRRHRPRRYTAWPIQPQRDTLSDATGARSPGLTQQPASRARRGVGSTTVPRRASEALIWGRQMDQSAAMGLTVSAPFWCRVLSDSKSMWEARETNRRPHPKNSQFWVLGVRDIS